MSLIAIICFIFVFAAPKDSIALPLDDDDVLIVGGDEVEITEYPHQAVVLLGGRFFCGGSIISNEYILTAAHCVYDMDVQWYSVGIGSSYTDGGLTYELAETFVHPNFNSRNLDYDVAVLKTSKKMIIDNVFTKIVKMADSDDYLSKGDNIIVTGWGAIGENGPDSENLRAVAVPVVSLESCKRKLGKVNLQVTNRMFCAGFEVDGKDACAGDSGGPAVDADSMVQYGIVSWGVGCARKEFPGVYTSVPAMRGWITQITGI